MNHSYIKTFFQICAHLRLIPVRGTTLSMGMSLIGSGVVVGQPALGLGLQQTTPWEHLQGGTCLLMARISPLEHERDWSLPETMLQLWNTVFSSGITCMERMWEV